MAPSDAADLLARLDKVYARIIGRNRAQIAATMQMEYDAANRIRRYEIAGGGSLTVFG